MKASDAFLNMAERIGRTVKAYQDFLKDCADWPESELKLYKEFLEDQKKELRWTINQMEIQLEKGN